MYQLDYCSQFNAVTYMIYLSLRISVNTMVLKVGLTYYRTGALGPTTSIIECIQYRINCTMTIASYVKI